MTALKNIVALDREKGHYDRYAFYIFIGYKGHF